MNKKLIPTMTNSNTAVLDSREVAEAVGKEHFHLVRDIRGYISVLDRGQSNFGLSSDEGLPSMKFFIPSTYVNSQNKTQPCYLITKLGCEFIANKLTGEKGIRFTAAYVEAFNEMQSGMSTVFLFDALVNKVRTDEVEARRFIQQSIQLAIDNQRLEEENAVMLPKAEKHDQLMASEGGVLMKGLAGFLVQNGVMWLEFEDGTKKKNGQNNLYQWMREQGYLCKAKGERYNLPMQKWIDAGLFALKAAVADIGGVKREVMTTIVTPKGQSYFLDLFIKKEAVLTVI